MTFDASVATQQVGTSVVLMSIGN